VVIDHLSEQPSHDGVAYLYFGYQDRTQQRPIDVFSIFTKQLVSQLPELPPDILEVHSKKGTESPGLEMLRRFLFSMPKRFSSLGRRVFIVCDALDEMDEHQQRDVLLPLFHDMEDTGFEIFLTSRPHPEDVRCSFDAAIQLELTPHYGDLRGYVEERITASPKTKKMIENSQSLQLENVITAVASSAEGM
jgi:Cdc6-like AAA superfamily ATPase